MNPFNMTRYSALILSILFYTVSVQSAPKSDFWPIWGKSNPLSHAQVDNDLWQQVLNDYLTVANNQTFFNYAKAREAKETRIQQYIASLSALTPTNLNADVQKAYWINLYNAVTVNLILEHFPTDSIKAIDISPGWFSSGPWDAKLITVEGQKLSLNDIEHRILRPIWKDNRIHYAVNCASLGCPNLAAQPYDSKRLDQQLTEAANAFINHHRGVHLAEKNKIKASSIYEWYISDFGGSESELALHWLKYAKPDLARKLESMQQIRIQYDYDWDLNQP